MQTNSQASHVGTPGRAWRFFIAALFSVALVHSVPAAPMKAQWTVTSPDANIAFILGWADAKEASGAGSSLLYRVEMGKPGSRRVVLLDSPLGVRLAGTDLAAKLRLEKYEGVQPVEEKYRLLYGKKSECVARANEISLVVRNEQGARLEVRARAYADGVAFCYRVLNRGDAAPGAATLEVEATGFHLDPAAKLWCAPSDKSSMYAPAYETYYESEMTVGTPSTLGLGWAFPLLYRTPDGAWGLITEAGVSPSFCASRLSNSATGGLYTVTLPSTTEGNGTGEVRPSAQLPWTMPWRVIILGSSLATMVESTLVTDVSEPSQVPDTTWVRPGRVAWSWWSDNPSPRSAPAQRQFIDLAAEMGWEYVLVDANWTIMEEGNLQEVLKYAKSRNVGVLLWYNSGGPHNSVTEKPRGCLTQPTVRTFELDLLKKWGVKGVKVDFFQSDKQDIIGLYHGIMRDAASRHIMVNFHGCTLPRGWERTYPHLMSMEAVRGAECYLFDPAYPQQAPVQNTILPFTRNAVGPMDYTPVAFSNSKYPHQTTAAHELALCVLFTSGWLHFADRVEAYRSLPPLPKEFLIAVMLSCETNNPRPSGQTADANAIGSNRLAGLIEAAKEPRPANQRNAVGKLPFRATRPTCFGLSSGE